MSAAPRYHALRVRAVVDESHDAKSLLFELPPELEQAFRYKPGQFLTLRLPLEGRRLQRCYSLSSVPATDQGLRVTVKRVAEGRASNWLCDQVRAGDLIEVMTPAGVFTPRSLDGDFLLLAGGSGITPVFSILRSALLQGSGRVLLVYANRDERSVIFRDELKALAAAWPTRLSVVHWLDSVQGLPSIAQLAELARPLRHGQAFVCGPQPYMEAAAAALQAIEMAPELIHVERFVSLPDEEEGAARQAAGLAGAEAESGAASAELEIRLDGAVHTLRCASGETLLDAALRAGLNPPYSCQAGLCASCMCQVLEGEVHLRHNEVLDKKDLAKAWTLACQAVPLSPRVRIQYPE